MLKPIVFYGTITSNYSKLMNGGDGICLSFLIIDPFFKIPMTSDAFTVSFDHVGKFDGGPTCWGWSESDVRRAKKQSDKIYEIFSKLALTKGLARLWVTPTNLLVQGYPDCLDAIASKIRSIMEEIFGEFEFHNVLHDEARLSR